jgi:hypothetical protein
MNEELGYEVTPKQSLDGLWKTMHKYIEQHGYSDISLEIEGTQYEFRQHLQKYDEYEAKAKAWDKYKAHMESHIAGEINEEEFVSDLKSDYFESGEPNAKK